MTELVPSWVFFSSLAVALATVTLSIYALTRAAGQPGATRPVWPGTRCVGRQTCRTRPCR
jgi:hypothetical protein